MKYRIRKNFAIKVGFKVTGADIVNAVRLTNDILGDLPVPLYRSLDFKTVRSLARYSVAKETKGIVNPIEKGHPDLVPPAAHNATEAQLRNYPEGLEVKCTVGNIEQGANFRAGRRRIERLTGITWQAHHREVASLMGLVWDFTNARESFSYPAITGVFYADDLEEQDWGAISGTTGRNTKVSGMRTSGKVKMGSGWIMLLDEPAYLDGFRRILGID